MTACAKIVASTLAAAQSRTVLLGYGTVRELFLSVTTALDLSCSIESEDKARADNRTLVMGSNKSPDSSPLCLANIQV